MGQQHTPGPWEVGITGEGIWGAKGSTRVANMERLPEREANARLIAAAPEMLEALVCMTEFVASLKSCVPDWAERCKVNGEGYTAKARAAISKATEQ